MCFIKIFLVFKPRCGPAGLSLASGAQFGHDPSMDSSPIRGGCYCGEIRYCASGPIHCQTNCHCANCRRAVGAQSVAWVIVDRKNFTIEKGEPRRFRTDTGAWRTFCPNCGTSLSYESDGRAAQVDLTTGSLDHPEVFPPKSDTWTEERIDWVAMVENHPETG